MNTFLVKCKCQHCSQNLEFEASRAGETVPCPGCNMETLLFIPRASMPSSRLQKSNEEEYSSDKKNIAIVFAVIGIVTFLGVVIAFADKEADMNPAVTLLLGLCGGILYFIPALVGSKKRQFPALFALNLLAGWTFIGWVGALVWALIKDKE